MMTWTGLIRRSIGMVRPGVLAFSPLYLLACGGSATGPGDQFRQPAPPLEQVAYEQLGSEKIMFQRTTEPVVRRASSFGEILSTTVKVLDPATGNVQTLVDVPGSGGGAGYHGMAPASLCYLPSGNAIVFTAAVAGTPRVNCHARAYT